MNMKRFFLVCFLAVAGIIGAQAQSYQGLEDRSDNSVEDAFVIGFIQGMDEELASLDKESVGMHYDGTVVEGKMITCRVIVDESQFGGVSLRAALRMVGVDEQAFGEMMRKEMFSQNLTADERVGLEMLRDYGYKIYFSLIGSQSGEKMNCPIDYEVML